MPLGEVLAQEPVGVLVGAALPRGVRVAEVDGHVQRGADPFVQGEFRSLVPGQAVAQEFGQVLHLVDDGLLDVFGVVPVGQVQQDREPGVRSTSVPMALLLRLPVMRSPSQWPGTARSSISSGVAPRSWPWVRGKRVCGLGRLGVCGRFAPASWRVSAPA